MTASESDEEMDGSATAIAAIPSNRIKALNKLFMSPIAKNAALGLAAHKIDPITFIF